MQLQFVPGRNRLGGFRGPLQGAGIDRRQRHRRQPLRQVPGLIPPLLIQVNVRKPAGNNPVDPISLGMADEQKN